MTLATICRSVAVRAGVAPVASWAGNPADTAREIVEFVAEATDMVVQAFDWQELLRTYSVAVAGVTVQTLPLPADYRRLIAETVWIDGATWRVRGPITEEQYERLRQSLGGGGETPAFRLSAGAIDLLSVQAPGGTLTLRYLSAFPVLSADGTPQLSWQADTDTAVVDERVIVLAAVMLWRDSKGLPAQMAMTQYLAALGRLKASNQPLSIMSLGTARMHDDCHQWVSGTGSGSGSAPSGPPDGALTTDALLLLITDADSVLVRD